MTNPLVLAAKYNKLALPSTPEDDAQLRDVTRALQNLSNFLTREHGKIETAAAFATSLAATVFNVLDYGADARGVRDASAAFAAAALAAEDAGGGVLWTPPGTFRLDSPVTLGANVVIRGSGAASVLDARSATGTIALSLSGADSGVEAVRIVGAAADSVESGRVDVLSTASRARVASCIFDSTFASVVVSADDVDVVGNWFVRYRLGVYLTLGSAGTTVRGNRFVSVAGSGIVAGYDGVLMEGTSTATVTSNVIAACREHGIYIAGLSTPNVGITVTGNSVSGHGSDGIKVLGSNAGAAAATDITVTGNTVTDGDATSGGITVGFANRVTVTGNLTTGQNRGIFVRGGTTAVTVTGNNASRNTASGIEVRDLSGDNIGTVVRGNTVNENDQAAAGFSGITVTCTGGFDTRDLVLDGNKCADYQSVPTQNYGIEVGAVSGGSTLTSIRITNTTGTGNTVALIGGAGLASAVTAVASDNASDLPRTVTTTATVTVLDTTVLADATAAAFDVDLPSAANVPDAVFTIKKIDASANAVTVDAGAATIDGAATYALAAQWQSITVQSNGTNWYIL